MSKVLDALPMQQIEELCRRWRVRELSVFGSALDDNEFGPDSDYDLLVSFDPETRYSLFDFVGLKQEFEELLGREVDLVEKEAIEQSRNPYRRKSILENHRPIYEQS